MFTTINFTGNTISTGYTGNTSKTVRILTALAVIITTASLLASIALAAPGRARADGLGIVYIHMSFQGGTPIPPTASLPAPGKPVEIMVAQDGKALQWYKDTLSADGSIKLNMDGLPDGIYQVWVKSPRFLAAQVDLKYSAGTGSAELGTLKAGDADNNNVITVGDFMIVRATFGKAVGDPGYDERADFNYDDRVNIQDVNLMRNNMGLAGPERPGK
jgi:hypothetical protein